MTDVLETKWRNRKCRLTLPTPNDVDSAIITQEFTTYGLIQRHIDPAHKWAWHVVRKGIWLDPRHWESPFLQVTLLTPHAIYFTWLFWVHLKRDPLFTFNYKELWKCCRLGKWNCWHAVARSGEIVHSVNVLFGWEWCKTWQEALWLIPLSYVHFCSFRRAPELWTFVHCQPLHHH